MEEVTKTKTGKRGLKNTKTSDKILVVIPYLANAAQGRELELAIAGWRKHFKADYELIVVGDWATACNKADTFIECPRVKWPGQGNYWAHIDHINKFKAVRELYPDSKGFIYTCDDIYAVRDFTIEDVLKPKVRCREITGSFHSANAWVRDNYRTKKSLEKAGLPVMNWVCHLPVYYEWDKLYSIWERYNCEKTSCVVEQLYFNTYFADSDYVVIEEEPNDWQYKVWGREFKEDEVKNAVKTKYWIVNSVKGWNPKLEEILAEHYGI